MAHLRLFASAREAAGRGDDEVPGTTVAEVLDEAVARYGDDFAHLLTTCRVWCNGEPAERDDPVGDGDEVAVLPPVSGGADEVASLAPVSGGADRARGGRRSASPARSSRR